MLVPALLLAMTLQEDTPATPPPPPFTTEDLHAAARVVGTPFTDAEVEQMLNGTADNLKRFERMRARPLDNAVPPALLFEPWALLGRAPAPDTAAAATSQARALALDDRALALDVSVARPTDLEELAFAEIPALASLIRTRKVSCVELTEMYLARLARLDATLGCVIALLPERALAQARALDAELAAGKYRGPLHGIPWGAKDLLSVRGARTTWGAKPYAEQVLDLDAAVVERLDAAGAVLIAKLSLGALAWGDVWFGGTTRNPWKPEQGSSGSSAGPAAATAAGGVAFAIGSETWGSIVTPSARCGNSSLRPTFGRVSRHGAMALAWSLDKLGPMARSLADAGLVFDAVQGADARDFATLRGARALRADEPVKRVGILAEAAERGGSYRAFLDEIAALGVELVPIELPDYPVNEMMLLLNCEAACAFDELTRSGRDDELVRQVEWAWPNVFRQAQLVPAVEYLRANRLRTLLAREFDAALAGVDAIAHPTTGNDLVTITNLTGHPMVVAPFAFRDDGTPRSVCFTGHLDEDERLVRFAAGWQRSTAYHLRHPAEPTATAATPESDDQDD
jgi:Asp-tRNA(Asn)/Glu-tRNA(Gln) amidotransferase A subunit family amidase